MVLEAPRLQNHVFYDVLFWIGSRKAAYFMWFYNILGSKIALSLREASGGALEAPESARRLPIGAKADF